MSEENASFAELFQESESKSIRRLNPGEKITATIVGISGESIFLDCGGKSEGILDASEIQSTDGESSPAVGDKLDVYFLQTKGGAQLFTISIGSGKNTEHLGEACRSGIPVEGVVKEEIKGGFEITLGGSIRAFCPYSQMGLRRVEDAAAEYIDQRMNFLITSYEENGRNIVVSARALLEQEREKLRDALQETLAEGDTLTGIITSIRDFGAFVDIGGVDGLVPISEIGWSRIENINDFYAVDQKVSVVIKKLDWDNNRITLSIKETLEDPWEQAAAKLSGGQILTGKVARLAQFGAFVTLAPGIDGLIHISKLGKGRRINHPREVLEEGQEIEVQIESIDTVEKRISLVPSDYVGPEDDQKAEEKLVESFQKSNKEQPSTLGTFGDLLQAKLAEKSK
ncbi:ribosomal protein S1 [Desulfocapsa sulfexigens DSM 10523]|uniref:Ribosomal protein S1 n=1 Tax=Desulfocapsa sulfexigens (strain DSM 10523 / SB164P1) TaxID=1167006 RepID=M1PQK3_DESSD|nr:30S ribosomal protein S1 [Desulfocapsa sulfexigens]AGF78681.1 ribosomal protein S1 [Desulfocapsa sulfexigens DSM 10523]